MTRPKKNTEKNTAVTAAPAPEEKKTTTKKEAAPAKAKSSAKSASKSSSKTSVKSTSKPAAKPSAKSAAKSSVKDSTFLIQSNGKDYTVEDIKEACKTAYRNGTRKQIKTCDVYLKVENGCLKAYYVINGKSDGAFIDL